MRQLSKTPTNEHKQITIMRTDIEIANLINDNTQRIIDNISNESIDAYNFIRQQFDNTNVKTIFLFQFVYKHFYLFDRAAGQTN
jgi:hypothetical protein